MKKLFHFILAGFMVLSLAACGNKEPKTTIMTVEESGILGEYTIEAIGDTVQKITQITSTDCSDYTEDELNVIQESIAPYQQIFDSIDGVSYTVGITNQVLIETLVIDAQNEEALKELYDQGLFTITDEFPISSEELVEILAAQGWELKIEQ